MVLNIRWCRKSYKYSNDHYYWIFMLNILWRKRNSQRRCCCWWRSSKRCCCWWRSSQSGVVVIDSGVRIVVFFLLVIIFLVFFFVGESVDSRLDRRGDWINHHKFMAIASCTPHICFLHSIKICEWTFIALLMKTKEVRVFQKTFSERDRVVGVWNLLWKIFFVRGFCIMENVFRKKILYYGKCF